MSRLSECDTVLLQVLQVLTLRLIMQVMISGGLVKTLPCDQEGPTQLSEMDLIRRSGTGVTTCLNSTLTRGVPTCV